MKPEIIECMGKFGVIQKDVLDKIAEREILYDKATKNIEYLVSRNIIAAASFEKTLEELRQYNITTTNINAIMGAIAAASLSIAEIEKAELIIDDAKVYLVFNEIWIEYGQESKALSNLMKCEYFSSIKIYQEGEHAGKLVLSFLY